MMIFPDTDVLVYATVNQDADLVYSSFLLGQKTMMNKNINDLIHLKYAEKYAEVIYTFDENFKKLVKHASLDIKILK